MKIPATLFKGKPGDQSFKLVGGFEYRHLSIRNRHFLAGPRVTRFSSFSLLYLKGAKSSDLDITAVFQALLLAPLISRIGSKKIGVVPWQPNKKEDLAILAELLETGKIVPVIDRRYPLSEVPEALRYLEEGRALGKAVITVADDSEA